MFSRIKDLFCGACLNWLNLHKSHFVVISAFCQRKNVLFSRTGYLMRNRTNKRAFMRVEYVLLMQSKGCGWNTTTFSESFCTTEYGTKVTK
jgi:hypothetical protein